MLGENSHGIDQLQGHWKKPEDTSFYAIHNATFGINCVGVDDVLSLRNKWLNIWLSSPWGTPRNRIGLTCLVWFILLKKTEMMQDQILI